MGGAMAITEARDSLTKMPDFFSQGELKVIRVSVYGEDKMAIVDINYLESLLETIDILSNPDAVQQLADSLKDIEEGRVRDWEDIKADLL